MKISKIILWVSTWLIVGVAVDAFRIIQLNAFLFPFTEKEDSIVEKSIDKAVYKSFHSFGFEVMYDYKAENGQIIRNDYFITSDHLTSVEPNSLAAGMALTSVENRGRDEELFLGKPSQRGFIKIEMGEAKSFYILGLSFTILWLFGFFFLLMLLRKLIRNFSCGDFFDNTNWKLIRLGGMIFILAPLYQYIVQHYLYNEFIPSTLRLTKADSIRMEPIEFDWTYVIVGLLLVTLAEAFKNGLKIYEEQKLTI